jgi:curved DNA-binding protein CbpA
MKDYYNILGVSRNATFYDITKAYRELSAEYDPEKKGGDNLTKERFNDIQEAYEILSNDIKRRQYDSNNLQVENLPPNEKSVTRPKTENTINTKKPVLPKNQSNSENQIKTKNPAIAENPVPPVTPAPTYIDPTIEFFKANKFEFGYEEEVIFRWKTNNADKVTLLPFGTVAPNEQKSYKIKDFKNKYITCELIAENTHTGKIAKTSVTLKNNLYEELFDFFKKELEKQYRTTSPLQPQEVAEKKISQIPVRPVETTPIREYQPIPEFKSPTTYKQPKAPKEKKDSTNIIGIIFKILLYLFFLVSLVALIYLGFFMN